MGVAQAEHLPRSTSQLIKGMFSYQRMACPQAGQRDAGLDRLMGSCAGSGCSSAAAASSFHCWSRISGMRWMTTLRKLPITSPRTSRPQGDRTTERAFRSIIKPPSDDVAKLEDG